MNRDQQSDLAKALAHEEDITDRFEVDLGGLVVDVVEASAATAPYTKLVRSWMENNRLAPPALATMGLLSMPDWAAPYETEVMAAIARGDVVAVDGTPVMTPQSFLALEVHSVAVASLSSRLPLMAQVWVSKARVPYTAAPKTKDEVIQFIKARNTLVGGESWPGAWMEYKVRDLASRTPQRFVLIDGPLMPQPLVTRPEGRALLAKMLGQTDKKFLAIIKDTKQSGAELRFYGKAIRTGELFVAKDIYSDEAPKMERYRTPDAFKSFLADIGAREMVRGVFKPGLKAFGFECRLKDLPEAVALLWCNRNDVPGFEIPFLLAQVDAQLRGQHVPGEATKVITASLMTSDPDEFYDEADERSFRP